MSETHTLLYPLTVKKRVAGAVEISNEVLTEVTVRRATGADIRWLENGGKPMGLLARLTGQTDPIIDLMDAVDIAAISEIVESFLPPSLRNGETSSGT